MDNDNLQQPSELTEVPSTTTPASGVQEAVSGAAQLQLLTQSVDEIRVTLLATSQRVSAVEKTLGELIASHAVHDSRIAAIETDLALPPGISPAPPLPQASVSEDEKENDTMKDEPVTAKEKADAEAYMYALGHTKEDAAKHAEEIGHREVLRAQREGRNPLATKK